MYDAATAARDEVLAFLGDEVAPRLASDRTADWHRDSWRREIAELRHRAGTEGLWRPHLPRRWGGRGWSVEVAAAALVAARTHPWGPTVSGTAVPEAHVVDLLVHHLGPRHAGLVTEVVEGRRPAGLVTDTDDPHPDGVVVVAFAGRIEVRDRRPGGEVTVATLDERLFPSPHAAPLWRAVEERQRNQMRW